MIEAMWQRKDNWVGSQIEDAFVMLNIEGGEYVTLNATATDVWNALETPQSLEHLVSVLTAHYDISASQCALSVERLLGELSEKGLVEAQA